MIKVCSFFVTISLIASTPLVASASFFSEISNMASVVLGTQATAEELDVSSNVENVTPNYDNSQNMDLAISLEPSVNPDLKNIDITENSILVQDDSFIYNDSFYVPDVKFEKSNVSDQIRIYTVEQGDTLSEIADVFNVSVNTIRWENNISGQTISVGQKLNILPVTGVKHIVKSGDTISKIADKYDAESEDILIFNGISKGDSLNKGDIIFVPNGIIKVVAPTKVKTSSGSASNTKAPSGYYARPVSGIVTSPYGPRKRDFHPGIDFGNVRGTPVSAAASGVVVGVFKGCVEGKSSCGGGYGNHIEIEHPNGTTTRYAHLSKISVSLGQSVSKGQKIGAVGNTGISTGPHLHFEIINANGSKMRPAF